MSATKEQCDELRAIKDCRFVGFFDTPPQGMSNHGKSMVHKGFDVWTNGASMFSPDMRWALVRTRELMHLDDKEDQ